MKLKKIRGAILKFLPDSIFIRLKFYRYMGEFPNLRHPKTFSEKLQWLKLHDRKPEYTTMVDKYEAKKYVAGIIGEEYIIPTYGVWDNFEDIDFDMLPNEFVLKCTHDNGSVIICQDKSQFDIEAAREKITTCLNRNLFWICREWPYKNVKPRIIAEKYLKDGTGIGARDYKVLCFGGKPKLIEVHGGRIENVHRQDFYDIDWKLTPISQYDMPTSGIQAEKPPLFDRMMELSEILAENFIHIRVDWYIVDGKLYSGELTFFDGSGWCKFEKEEYDLLLGSWIKLPTDGI